MQEFKFGTSILKVSESGKLSVFTERSRRDSLVLPSKLNFEIHENAEQDEIINENVKFAGLSFCEGVLTVSYTVSNLPLTVESRIESFEGTNALRITNTVVNGGSESLDISYLSSAYVDNLGASGSLPWYDENKIRVHYCYNSWQKEGQWKSSSLEMIGITPGTSHSWERSQARFSSIGTHSTKKYYPLVMVEDLECGTVWFMEIEGANAWEIDVGSIGGMDSAMLYLRASAADEANGAWRVTLAPGEKYVTRAATLGCVDGGFDEAAREIIAYKRATSLISFENREIPVVFNDYMDCLWCQRSEEKMTRVIDAAADVGCEVFCIDAGWYKNRAEGENWSSTLGDWDIDDRPFGKRGLAGTLDYIRSKGMKAGVWFEFEACNPTAALYEREGAILTRKGHKINSGRAFVNFCDESVVAHLEERVDALYALGVRYIKNDYNCCVGIGTDIRTDNAAEGLIKNTDAFYAFIDKLVAKYPDLTIENCGGGGLREDAGTLRHFFLQSTSDQEFYYNNPSIICGSMAYIQPEKAGIWSYPYPVMCDDATKEIDESYFENMSDGEQTVFNMVNAMCGSLYLSGRIDFCDEYNKSLVREAVDTFKSYRGMLKRAYPIFPLGQLPLNKRGYLALGLVADKELLLAVWKIGAVDESAEIDLSSILTDASSAEMLYPAADKAVTYVLREGKLTVRFPGDKKYMARMLRIKI